MNTRALRCFIEVYEKKSVAAAAREIYISPQGLSKIIKQLEFDLEADLFFRGAQGMEATEAGELLYARARHICYLLDDIKKEIGILGGSKGALHVILTYSAAAVISYEVLHQYSSGNSSVQLKIEEYPDEYPVHELFQDEADVGILFGHDDIANCSSEPLLEGRSVLCVSLDHPLAGREEISVAELNNMELVVRAAAPGRENALLAACRKAGVKPTVSYSTGNLAAMRTSCKLSGLAAESIDFIERAFPDENVVVLKIKERIEQNIYLVSRDRDIQNRAVTQFQSYVKEKIIK